MEKLRIVFIGYWGLDDNLTESTILPWLHLMQLDENVEQVLLFTIERDDQPITTSLENLHKVRHHSLVPLKNRFNLLTKISDFLYFPKEITRLARQIEATKIFAHGAPAGALAYKVWQKLQLPFYVSSFEPHADYMAESGEWGKGGLKFNYQKQWEKKQLKYATGLITVSENYKLYLIQSGVPENKTRVVNSPVNLQKFEHNVAEREQLRNKLGWRKSTTGIYVGKYGGLYYNEEAFQVYEQCFKLIPDFRLIILTPQPQDEITQQLSNYYKIDLDKVYVASVPHEQVPAYLSAADFALATYKPGPSKRFLSPVKIGEYWANGLPVLLTEGVGDDSDIIKNEGGGALFNLLQNGSLERAIDQILAIVSNPAHRQEIPKLAIKYRSSDRIRETYEYFFARHNSSEL